MKLIKYLKKSDTWKIYQTISIIFMSSIDTDKERLMDSNNGNVETMINDKAGEIIEELF